LNKPIEQNSSNNGLFEFERATILPFHSIPNKQSIHIRHVSLRRRNSSGGSHSGQQHRKQEVWPDESGGIRHDHRGEGSPAEINLLGSIYKTPHRKEAEEEVNRFLAPFKALLHLCFPALAECDAECEEQLARTDAAIEFYFNLIFFSGVAGSYFPSIQSFN